VNLSKILMVTVATLDASSVTRGPKGHPTVDGDTIEARLCLATQGADGGWLLEVWSQDGPTEEAELHMELTDETELADQVARTVRRLATGRE
jgi:hypothetical protein